MATLIAYVLSNFTLTFFVLGLIAAGIALALKRGYVTSADVAEELLAYFILFSIALSFFYNFVMHVFFSQIAAAYVGWAVSPFQHEVGFASVGFAAVGLLAFKGSFDMRLAAILGPALFLWGAAAGHIYEIIVAADDAQNNAGIMLYSDILLPVIGFALLWFKRRSGKAPTQTAMAAHAIRG
jgi:Family of unknown function (DUF6790)